MKTKFFALLTILFSLALTSVDAQTAKTPRHAKQRINQGIGSRELTGRETRILAMQQRDIHQDKKEARADGKITVAERKHIRKDEKRANHSIYRKKHNARDRD